MDDSPLCCAKAIIYALAIVTNNEKDIEAFRKRGRLALRKRAEELIQLQVFRLHCVDFKK